MCPRTLVDRKRKRYNNAVDVVVRLHSPTDQAPKLRHLRVLAHVQLDNVPRTPIQLSVEGEFHQHDGVVTMMMFYRRRASPKHRYDIIEVDYGGGGHRTWLREDLVCPLLGNVVIPKKFLRTRKIMVMHSNERGECCPRTLVDRKRKR